MCGFAGVIAWDEKYRVSRETLGKMSAAIAHRGPDGEGFHFSDDAPITPDRPQVALAFRRLAILDPDPRSMQPFTDGRHWLVFNGEIYNFRELKKELSSLAPNYEWRTTGDTEVLLLSYAVWGEKCVEHLNGMFAFAVWDEVEKSLFLARDRMGQKPLYVMSEFVQDERAVVFFASELDAIPKASPPEGEAYWLTTYLRYGYGLGSTPWINIRQLHSAEFRVLPQSRSGSTSYFNTDRGDRVSDDVAVEQTRQKVRCAVQRQLVSDVPLGVFLSGGIDSSVIAACARRTGPIHTFSIAFDNPAYDESCYAKAVADHLGTEHHEFRATADHVVEVLPRLARAFGEPFADSSAIPTQYLCEATRRQVKVALSGDGGDELFGGYERYRALQISRRLRWFKALSPFGRILARGDPKAQSTRVGRLVASLGGSADKRYERMVRLFDDETVADLWPDAPPADRPLLNRAFRSFERQRRSEVEAALASDRHFYLPHDLLTKVDRCSMLHGLEVRSPFMDHELVQFAAGLTTDQLLKGGPKRMLREAFKDDLPAWVFKRKKMGFAVPIGDWFRGELRPMLRDTLFSSHAFGRTHFDMKVVERLVDEHESKRVDHSQRLYALLMLELWWNTART